MAKETSTINILTYKLPFDLANQIYKEFQDRFKDATYLIINVQKYKPLKNSIKTVEVLLSLSIFYRRVVTNFDGAIHFYDTVTKKSEAQTVQIGKYDLNADERNQILAVVMSYNKLIQKFSIPNTVMEYLETKEFLKNLIDLKIVLNTNEQRDNTSKEDDLPF
ncbi:MAG: hypothetical protein Q8M15_08945 [Bacteroidota bacterium]|nr:hypothetical protein [Bacteroidota bacterium]